MTGFPSPTAIRLAIRRGEFRLLFQPIVALSDGSLQGVEALVRWHHPLHGTLAPGAFIPPAERSGAIVDLGAWVLEHAARAVAGWTASGRHPGFYVSVNVSPRQLDGEDLAGVVAGALDRGGASARSLSIEITESSLMEVHEYPVATLEALKATGVRVVLDDFGTGYSSLSYLTRFPLDGLKIDRSFIAALDDPAAGQTRAVIAAVAGLGQSLGLPIVAEGVETHEQANEARMLGCQCGQGFYFARPMTATAVTRMLRDRT